MVVRAMLLFLKRTIHHGACYQLLIVVYAMSFFPFSLERCTFALFFL